MNEKVIKILGVPIYKRELKTGPLTNSDKKFIDALRGTQTDAGVSVNEDTALTISAVWRAVNVVSGTLAFLPRPVYRKNDKDGRDHLADHQVQKVVNNPNTYQTDFNFFMSMQSTKMLYGNAYAIIIREGGRPAEMMYIHPTLVEPVRTTEGIVYRVAGMKDAIMQKDMIHIHGLSFDGLKGKSAIEVYRDSLGLTKAAETFGARLFGSGTKLSGVIEVPAALNDTSYNNLKNSWDESYRGLGNSHGTPILEAGATFKPITIPPEDAQFLQTRKFQVEEVARWFGVQPHLLLHLERSTNNNIEHQGMEFVTYTMAPEIANWESELNRKLFTNGEKRDHYVEFNINALLRGDSKARSDFYRGMFAVGALSPNQIKKLENMPAYEGGDRHYVQAGFVPVDKIDEMYSKKINITNNENTDT